MDNITLLEQFKEDCQVVEFKYEYPGYIGYEQYGIITELSDSELTRKYKEIVKCYSPYIILDMNYKKARDEYRKNEKKHNWRATNAQDCFGYEDDETEHFHPELLGGCLEDQIIEESERDELRKAIELLSEVQKKRIDLYFFHGYTVREIATIEGKSHIAVLKSLKYGIKKLKKILETGYQNASPTGNK